MADRSFSDSNFSAWEKLMAGLNFIDAFRDAMAEHALEPGAITPDGQIHRFSVNGGGVKGGFPW
jgi:hypothetical protein